MTLTGEGHGAPPPNRVETYNVERPQMSKADMIRFLSERGLFVTEFPDDDRLVHIHSPREMPDFVWSLSGWVVTTVSCGCVYLTQA